MEASTDSGNETCLCCANKWVDEQIEDKGMHFRMPFQEVIGSPGKSSERAESSAQHILLLLLETQKAIPHVRAGFPLPPAPLWVLRASPPSTSHYKLFFPLQPTCLQREISCLCPKWKASIPRLKEREVSRQLCLKWTHPGRACCLPRAV